MKTIDYGKCGKYLSYMFWMLIPNIISELLTNENLGGKSQALFIVGTAIHIVCLIAYAFFLWQLQTEEELYRTAAIIYLAGAVWSVIDDLILRNTKSIALSILFGIIGMAIAFAQIYFLYEAHSTITEEADPELSEKWMVLRKRYFIAQGLVAAGVVLLFIPVLAALCAIVGGIMLIVMGILELVYLYRSAQACKKQQQGM